MPSLEAKLADAVKQGKVPNAVVFATNGDGSFTYSHAAGKTSLDEDAAPVTEDSIFLLASSTKLLTAIAALQLVEKGLVTLDEDLRPQMPGLAEKKILVDFDKANGPSFKDSTKPITLRQLITHTSGIPYDYFPPIQDQYRESLGKPPSYGPTVAERGKWPLSFEPGSQWMYGMGLDWAGKLIESLSGEDLDTYMQKHIFAPVGAKDLTFWPNRDPDVKSRKVRMVIRKGDGNLVPFDVPFIADGVDDAFGGHGCFGSMKNYIKVQQSILANDGKLLKSESIDEMFRPQLSPELQKSLAAWKETPSGKMFIGEFTEGIPLQHGLGGIIFQKSDEGKRTEGTLSWGGVLNTFWTIDRKADLALTFGTQVMLPGDAAVASVISEVELAIYKMAGVSTKL